LSPRPLTTLVKLPAASPIEEVITKRTRGLAVSWVG
jgi:hypothetical protein